MSGLAWVFQLHSVMEGMYFRGKDWMSWTSGGAGCPGWCPDVRATLVLSDILWIADAGFPGQGPDVRLGLDIRPL